MLLQHSIGTKNTYVNARPPDEERNDVVLLDNGAPGGVHHAVGAARSDHGLRERVDELLARVLRGARLEREVRDLGDGSLERLERVARRADVHHVLRGLRGHVEEAADRGTETRVRLGVVHEPLVVLEVLPSCVRDDR